MNEPRPENNGRTARHGHQEPAGGGGRNIPRRGDRGDAGTGRGGGARTGGRDSAPGGGGRRRDNSSFGERRGKRYDGSERSEPGGGRHSGPGRPGDRDGDRRREHGRPGQRDQGRPGQEARERRRADEPALPEEIEASELDPTVRRDLRTLDKANADMVARHLVASIYLGDDDPVLALAHGRAAKSRAGRIGVVRETLGVLAYRAGEWSEALGELRAARRISGGPGLLAMMADCERGLQRPEKAIEIARGDESRGLDGEDLVELRIVEAGARVDMGQLDAALVTLQDAGLSATDTGESAARLDYAYAEILVAAGRRREAAEWFGHAVSADPDQHTDAEARLAELQE